jgi:hypothetical protein
MFATAAIQCAVAGIAGSILAANILIFNTGHIPAESDSLTYAAWGMVIGILMFLFANMRYSLKQKAAYVTDGGDPTVSLASFMFGGMGGHRN